MNRPESLADSLGLTPKIQTEETVDFSQVTDPQTFAKLVLESREFRNYVLDCLRDKSLPAAIVTRLMDYAWGAPVKRVEVRDTTPVSSLSKHQLLEQIASLSALASELPDDTSIN